MSNAIDKRVVEMQFNNQQFEKGVSQSLSTLDKLKAALHFDNVSDGLSKLNFSSLSSSVSEVGQQFSMLEQIAIGALRRIGDQGVVYLSNAIKQLSIGQIMEGWGKYGEMTSNVATIMSATGDDIEIVSAQMEKLLYFTDETSYNFTDMANNIGKFTANGIELSAATSAMEGIATWAAKSGQTAGTASRVMYNLSQAIGMGALKLQDWKSVELANMGTKEFKEQAIEAAIATGTLTKGVDGLVKTTKGTTVDINNFRETLAEGWLDSSTLMETLNAYGKAADLISDIHDATGLYAADMMDLVDKQKAGTLTANDLASALGLNETTSSEAKDAIDALGKSIEKLASDEYKFSLEAYKAGQEARTFKDAIDATKDAVSSGWMKTFELIFGRYDEAKQLWTGVAEGLWDIFASGAKGRNDILKQWGAGGWETLEQQISKAGVSLEDFESKFTSAAKGLGVDMDSLIDEYGSLDKVIREGGISSKIWGEASKTAINSLIDGAPIATEKLASAEDQLKAVQKVVSDVWSGSLGNGSDRKKAIEELGYEYDYIQGLVEKGSDYVVQLSDLNDEQLKSIGLTQEQIELLREIGDDSALLNDLAKEGGRAMVAESILNTLQGIADVIGIIRGTFSEVFGIDALSTITNISTAMRDFSRSLILVDDESGELTENGEKVSSIFQKIFSTAKSVTNVFQSIGRIIGQFTSTLGPVISALGNLGDSFLKLIRSGANRFDFFLRGIDLTEKFQSISNTAANVINFFADAINSLADKFSIFNGKGISLENATNAIKEFVQGIRGLSDEGEEGAEKVSIFSRALDALGKALAFVKKIAAPVWETLKNMFGGMKNMFDFSKVQSLGDFFQQLVAGIGEALGGLWKGLKEGVKNLDISLGDVLKTFAGLKLGQALLNGFKKGGLTSALKSLVGNIDESIGAFREGGIMGLLTGTKSGGKGGFDFDQFAESLYKIGKAILMVAGALILLAAVDPNKLGNALFILVTTVGLLTGIMIGFIAAAKGLKANFLDLAGIGFALLAGAAAMLITAVALLALAGALEVFILVAKQGDDAVNGMLAMGAALGMVVVALLALAVAGPTVLASAGALLIAAAALLVFAVALEAFTLIVKQGSDVAVGLVVMVGALMLLVGALAILTVLGPGVIVAAGSLLIAAAAMGVLALAIGAVVVVLTLVGPMLISLGAGFSALGKGLGEAISGLLTGIAQGGVAIAQMLVVLGTSVGMAIVAIGSGLGAGIEAAGSGIGAGLTAIGAGLGAGLELIGVGIGNGFQAIGDGIGGAFESVGEGVAAGSAIAGAAVEMLGENISNAFETVAGGISEASTVVSSAVDELGSSIGESIEGVGASIESSLTKVSSGISTLSSSLSDVGSGLSGVAGGIDDFKMAIGGLAELPLVSIGAGMVKVSDGIKKLNKNPLTIDTSQVTSYVAALAELGTLSETIGSSFESVEAGITAIGKQIGMNLGAGIASSAPFVRETALNLAKLALTATKLVAPEFTTTGASMGAYMSNGLLSQSGAAQDAGHVVARSAYRGTLGYYTEFYHTGENMAQGLADGLNDKADVVRGAGRALAQAVLDELRAVLSIRSPSRVTRAMGENIGEGFVLGIRDSTPMVTEAAAYMANNMLSAAQSIADQVNGILEDPDSQPTITPVLDLTTLRGQAGAIDSIVTANRTMALSGRIAGQMDYNQNGGIQNVVALDPVTIAEIAANQPDININFEGSLAQLARILQPAIVDETNRVGINLVNE